MHPERLTSAKRWHAGLRSGFGVLGEAFYSSEQRQPHAHGIHSPYVWACTDQYAKGRYVADGRFDANAESRQCGAVAMLKGLIATGSVSPPAGPK